MGYSRAQLEIALDEMSSELIKLQSNEPSLWKSRVDWLLSMQMRCERLAFMHNRLVFVRQDEIKARATREALRRCGGKKHWTTSTEHEAHMVAAEQIRSDREIDDHSGANQMFVRWATMYGTMASAELAYYTVLKNER